MSDFPAAAPLDYSPSRAGVRRRFWLIGIVLGAALSPIVAWLYGKFDWYRRMQWPMHVSVQHCMSFTQSVGRVVYEEDAKQAAALAGGRMNGPDWATLTTSPGHIAGYFTLPPQSWLSLNGFGGPNIFPYSNNLVFLHEVQSIAGQKRLVYVSVNNMFALRQGNGNDLHPGNRQESEVLDWIVLDPGTLTTAPRTLTRDSWGDGEMWIRMPWPIRIFAGQPDASDPTKFSITYRSPDGPATIIAQLGSDGRLTFTRPPVRTKP